MRYAGILPDLFREGQGIVASGVLEPGLGLQAEEVLAKHDENYMPPEVAEAMEIARRSGKIFRLCRVIDGSEVMIASLVISH